VLEPLARLLARRGARSAPQRTPLAMAAARGIGQPGAAGGRNRRAPHLSSPAASVVSRKLGAACSLQGVLSMIATLPTPASTMFLATCTRPPEV
jgi:hypothetical protein